MNKATQRTNKALAVLNSFGRFTAASKSPPEVFNHFTAVWTNQTVGKVWERDSDYLFLMPQGQTVPAGGGGKGAFAGPLLHRESRP